MSSKKNGIKLGNSLDDRSIRFNVVITSEGSFDALGKEYQILKIRCKDYSKRNDLSVVLRKQDWILAVRNSSYDTYSDEDLRVSVFVFCRIAADNQSRLESIIKDMDNPDIGKPIYVPIPEVPPEVVLQLLANSLHHHDGDRINNVLGRCLEIVDYKDYGDENKGIAKEIVCLEYLFRKLPSISMPNEEDVALTFGVVTLTNTREKNKIDFRKGKTVHSYPHFVKDRYGLRIADFSEDSNAEQYIERTTRYHEKNVITFFHSWSLDVLNESRSAHVNRILEKIKTYYPEMGLDLKRIDTRIFEPVGNTSNVYHNELARRIVETSNFDFINLAGDEYVPLFNDIVSQFSLTKRPSLDGFFEKPKEIRIVVIHNEEYYRDEERFDEYLTPIDTDCIQHLTVESIEEGLADCRTDSDKETFWKILVGNSLENIAVKLENQKKSMMMTKWPLCNIQNNPLKGDYTFAMRARELEDDSEEDPEPVFVRLAVHSNGSIEDIAYLNEEDEDHYELFKAINVDPVNIELVVEDDSGNINQVWKTEYVTIPETEPMEERIRSNKEQGLKSEGIASRDGREELYPECVDIGYKIIDGRSMYYYVGQVGPGVKKKFQNAVNVRRVRSYKESKLFFEELIPTLSVPYVRHDQSTVHPFPCKNITEWVEDEKRRIRMERASN